MGSPAPGFSLSGPSRPQRNTWPSKPCAQLPPAPKPRDGGSTGLFTDPGLALPQALGRMRCCRM